MQPLRVLIGCEFSGIVRDAFRARGFDAWSCDVLCCERGPKFHIRDDVINHLNDGWDLMIAHPPCTYLSYAGTRWWNQRGREAKRLTGMKFFMAMYESPIPSVAIENPQGYPNVAFRRPDQTVNPFDFGDQKRKRICLWLRNLPLLVPVNPCPPPPPQFIHRRRKGGMLKNTYSTDALPISCPTRSQRRSRFFPGISSAMAQQWGDYAVAMKAVPA